MDLRIGLLTLTIGLVESTIFAQFTSPTNLLSNGSFELGVAPTCWAHGDFAEGWMSSKVVSNEKINHSPDLFDDNINFYAASTCSAPFGQGVGEPKLATGAKTGQRYMGLAGYELIQQHISALTPGRYYTISMYIAARDNSSNGLWTGQSGRLKVGLARHQVEYKSGMNSEICMENYISYQDGLSQEIVIVGSLDLNYNMFSYPGEWKRVSFSFVAPDDGLGSDFDFLFIDVEKPNFSGANSADENACVADYVYIDEVGLHEARFCGALCAPELGALTFGYYEHNGANIVEYGTWQQNQIPNLVYTGTMAFSFYVINAVSITMEVISNSNQLMHTQRAFDSNGLKDPGHNDYFFGWNGFLANGTTLPQGTYWIHLRMENCNPGNLVTISFHQVQYQVSLHGPGGYYDIQHFELDDCCQENVYHQNVIFNGLHRTDVHDFIVAGENVTTGANGPVVVSSGSYCLFHAGNSISLEPGFIVEFNGTYVGVISDCIYGAIKSSRNLREMVWLDESMRTEPLSEELLYIFPNPVRDEVFLRLNGRYAGLVSYEILDKMGRIVISRSVDAAEININVSEFVAGVYVVRLYTDTNVHVSQFIKI